MPEPILWTRDSFGAAGKDGSGAVKRIPYNTLVMDNDGNEGAAGGVREEDEIQSTHAAGVFELTTELLTRGHVVVSGVPSNSMEVARFAQAITKFQGNSSVRSTNWGLVNLAFFSPAEAQYYRYETTLSCCLASSQNIFTFPPQKKPLGALHFDI
jgi:hypothetical protein